MPAEWRGEWYKRKKSGTWRNANTGRIAWGSPGRTLGRKVYEARGEHSYGADPVPLAEALRRRRTHFPYKENIPPETFKKKKEPDLRRPK